MMKGVLTLMVIFHNSNTGNKTEYGSTLSANTSVALSAFPSLLPICIAIRKTV